MMNTRDQQRDPELTRQDLDRILSSSGVDPALLHSWHAMAGGTYNAVHRIRMTNGSGLILKVAPGPGVPALTYERGLLAAEELFYKSAAQAKTVPVPQWTHVDRSREVLNADYLIMSECAGRSWYDQRDKIAEDDPDRLRQELGRMTAALHQVTGPGFGYPTESVTPLSSHWRDSFLAMTTAVLTDAIHFGAHLPRPAAAIGELLHAAAPALDHVTTPALVHFDLWDGNILIDATGRTPSITGIIDGERMMWGDPAADFVSLALFGDIEQDGPFLTAYRAAGGNADFDERLRVRLALYKTYLYLIMLTEAVPRAYSGTEHLQTVRRVRDELTSALDLVERSLR
jgi:aminoglycoside phosphotransferase (APT) family kinase protein